LGLGLIALLVLIAIFAGVISRYDPYMPDVTRRIQTPSAEHWFGTDNLGRDLFARCMHGARWSLSIGVFAMVLALVGGGMLGMVAAFFGRGVDNAIMRVMDVFQAIPSVLMAITVVAVLGTGMPQLFVAMFFSNMPNMSNIVRAAIFTVRGNEYIQAAKCVGSGSLRLMFRHMLPNAFGHIVVFVVFSISQGILMVATLSFIGLGVPPPHPEWGSLLATGRNFIMSHPHMTIFPGLMIMFTILGFNLLGDGLRDALDPRLK
jgi:peptide/nickel transport system permease protein